MFMSQITSNDDQMKGFITRTIKKNTNLNPMMLQGKFGNFISEAHPLQKKQFNVFHTKKNNNRGRGSERKRSHKVKHIYEIPDRCK